MGTRPTASRLFTLLVAALATFCAPVVAGLEFEEGVHYQKLPIAVETRDAEKVEVVEVFSYACIHCYRLEPVLEAWRETLPDDVDFRRLPLVTQRLLPFARAFYTAEALGVLERVHMPIFTAIHEHGIDMSRPEYIRRLFLREAAVADEAFTDMFKSFGVESRVRQADGQARMYRIMATPTLVVNGRYIVEAAEAGGVEAMFLVVNQLIGQEREAAGR